MLKTLYETKNPNQISFLKSNLLSLKMDQHESIRKFISRVEYLSEKLVDIGKKISNIDLVTITLKYLVPDYQTFISSLSARENPPTFDELKGIILQEEERTKSFYLGSSSSYFAFVAMGKNPYRGKPWDKRK